MTQSCWIQTPYKGVSRQKHALEMRARCCSMLAACCLLLHTVSFSFWPLEKPQILCFHIFFHTKLIPFPLEEHWFLLACCFCGKPNPFVDASRLLGIVFSSPHLPQSQQRGNKKTSEVHYQPSSWFIYLLCKLLVRPILLKNESAQLFKTTRIVPLNAPIEGFLPPSPPRLQYLRTKRRR